jgi:2-polyprenyl-6-hydroxyphenyl methylase/3-demethylubiquinone-9 3-methyltransferase
MTVDNSIYDQAASGWWDENHFLHLLKTGLNPARFGYFFEILRSRGLTPASLRILDVGCGGGILSEEFAKLGCRVSGIDQSAGSIAAAQAHAQSQGLEIDYRVAQAESLPFDAASFDLVVCCDLLEHVSQPGQVVAEAGRLLKPGGLYLFDTINRTLQSYFETILVAQVLPFTRIFPPQTHAWRQFIRPAELATYLERAGLQLGELCGLQSGLSNLAVGQEISRLKRGEINYAELGRRLKFQVAANLSVNYIGYAVWQS